MLILGTAVLTGISAVAAETPLLEVDFGSSSLREIIQERNSGVSQAGNVISCIPKAYMATITVPVRKGDYLKASVEASCQGIQDGNAGWDIGGATVRLLDKTKHEVSHHDILLIRGDTPWRTYAQKIAPDERCAFISVAFFNSGRSGQISFRNFKLSVLDNSDELIGGGGFESPLGSDWSLKRSGYDWDGFRCWQSSGRAVLDPKVSVIGKQSLRLSGGGATVVSKSFPYGGENLILSGWLRAASIKEGRTKECGGAVQLVGLDAQGVPICHNDLNRLFGTSLWTFQQTEFTFPDSVKKVQVWLRMFEGANGALWLDEIRLRSQSLDKAPLPFDKDKAAVSIDFAKQECKEINYKTWAGVDACGSSWLTHPEVQQCFPRLKAAGFEYIRLRDMSNMLGLYPRDGKDGKPEYHWEKFDKLFDVLVKDYRFIPIITLGTTPPALDRPGSRQNNWSNERFPADLKRWSAFTEATFEHVIQRYGKEEAGKWLWEIWNEPHLPEAGVGTLEEFADLVVSTYQAKERVDAKYGIQIMLGLSSGGTCDEYLVQRLKSVGKQQLIEHRSSHYYAGCGTSIDSIRTRIAEDKYFKKLVPGIKDYPIGCTEWNSTGMFDPRPNTAWNTAMAVKMVKLFLDEKLDYATYFDLVDHPECPVTQPQVLFPCEFGLFTRPNDGNGKTYPPIPKPVYNAFIFLNELKGGKRLPLKSSNDPVNGIAVAMPDGAIRMVLTSYDEDIERQPYVTNVTIEVKGLPSQVNYRCTRLWAADERYGNSYGKWLELGKTSFADVKANKKIMAASKYGALTPPVLSVKGATVNLSLPLPGPGIRLLELKPDKIRQGERK